LATDVDPSVRGPSSDIASPPDSTAVQPGSLFSNALRRVAKTEHLHLNENAPNDPRLYAIPDIHGHAKGEHKAFSDERPIPLSARMLFLWFYHACRRGWPRFMMVTDHMNYLTFEDPAAINLVRRALKLAQAGDLYGAAETASVEVGHAAIVSEGLRRGMRYSLGAEVDNDPRSRPDAQNIVDAMKPDGMIRSVHFLAVDHPVHGPNWNWPFDNPEFADVFEIVGTAKTWELYMATLLDAIERLPGNIVGHFYVPALFGHWPDDATLDGYENQLVDACEARGMAVEFNTRFLYREHSDEERTKYLAAHRRLLGKCKAKNVGIAVGSDAHSPKDQGGAFETVLALLDECEINELVFPIGGRLARVALRVERKIEPISEPPTPVIEERKASRKRVAAAEPPAPVARIEAVAPVDEALGAPSAEREPVAPADHVAEPVAAPRAKSRPKRAKPSVAPTSEPVDVAPREAATESASDARPSQAEASSKSAATVAVVPAPVVVEFAAEEVTGFVTDEPVEPIVTLTTVEREVEPEPVAEAPEPETLVVPIDLADEPERPAAEPAGAESVAAEPAALEPVQAAESAPAAGPTPANAAAPARTAARKPRPKPTAKSRAVAVRPKAAASKAKPAAKKTAKSAAKSGAKKIAAKKSAAKKAAPAKASVKKSPVKKAPPKKVASKKAAIRATGAKKRAVKKAVAKKSTSKKPAQRRR
jgi:HisJ family histidinol phosphate phosphatase